MLIHRVASLFDLSVVRSRSLIRASVFYFLLVSGVTALKSATNALYLARRDPTDLPYLYLATAGVVAFATAFVGRRLTTTPAKPILRFALVASAALLTVLGVLAAIDFRAALGVLYVAGEVYATVINVLFWARLGDVFDVRAAKRIFGTIGAAGMAGAVLGGLLVRWLARDVPSAGWCFFAVLTLILALRFVGGRLGRGAISRPEISFRDGLLYAAIDRFPRGVALLMLLLSVQTAAVDYVFRTGAVSFERGSEAGMAGLFGVLNAVVGVFSIAVQVFLTAPLLRRFGVFSFLGVVPVTCIAAACWSALAPAMFIPLFLLKTFEMMGSLSLNQPGFQLLYNPMPRAVRDSVRALVDGSVKKIGVAVGGVVLLLVGSLLEQEQMLLVVVALALLILVWIRTLKTMYVGALEAKLGGKGALAEVPSIDPSDRATREQLIIALKDDDAATVIAAISVLERERGALKEHLGWLISHPAEVVRMKAIDLITVFPDPTHAPLLVAVLQNDARRPKAHAARALVSVDPETARRVLEPILDGGEATHDLGLVCAAIVALLPTMDGAPSKAELALRRLLERGERSPPHHRREIARLLGLLGPGPYAGSLAGYLEDPEPSVRLLAVKSAALVREPMLRERLVARLGDRHLQRAARDALTSYGDDVVPELAAALDDRTLPLGLRVCVPRVLRRIGTERAAAAMLYSNRHDDAFLRYVIVEELSRMRRMHPSLLFDRERTRAAVSRRLRAYTHYRPISADLGMGPPEFSLLRRAVEDRVRQNLEAALRLLGLHHDALVMENAFHGMMKGSVAHADAVELVDVALEGSDVRAEVLSHLEPHAPVPSAARAIPRALAICEGRDTQLALIAQESLRRIGATPPEVREPTIGEPMMSKTIVDRVFLLEGVQLFHGLSVDDLAAVAALTTDGHAGPGETVYREGDLGDSMFIIISGEVRLLRGGKPLMDLTPGDSFGQVSILDRGTRPVTARAGDVGAEFLVLDRQPFMDLVADRPEVVHGLFIVLARRLRELLDLTGDHGSTARASSPPTDPPSTRTGT